MELWDLYDRDRLPLGRQHIRGEVLAEGTYHTIVHCCVFNSMGQMLIQQRQPFKHGWSNLWDITVGGSAITGESSRQAIERELFEEVSIRHDFSNTRPLLTVNFDCGFDDIYIITKQVDIETLTLQQSEVQSVMWASMQQILEWIDNGTFIPYHKSLIRAFFEMRGKQGAINS